MSSSSAGGNGDLTVVIPAFDEAQSVETTLDELLRVAEPRGWQILVVDDGSGDHTGDRTRDRGVPVLRHKVRRGYGGALKTGLSAAATEWVVTLDADGQHDPRVLPELLELARAREADMVVGSREGSSGGYRGLGKWIIRLLTRILMPHPIRDLNSGLKLYRTALVQRYLGLCPDSMAFSDVITLVFLHEKHLVLEHSVPVRPREKGKSTITTQTAFETVREILNIMTLFNPMRIFLPLAFLAWGAGLAWGIPLVLRGRGVSVGSMLALVTGVILFALGLLAEQLAAIRKQQVADEAS